jgi:hypothetical protein
MNRRLFQTIGAVDGCSGEKISVAFAIRMWRKDHKFIIIRGLIAQDVKFVQLVVVLKLAGYG